MNNKKNSTVKEVTKESIEFAKFHDQVVVMSAKMMGFRYFDVPKNYRSRFEKLINAIEKFCADPDVVTLPDLDVIEPVEGVKHEDLTVKMS